MPTPSCHLHTHDAFTRAVRYRQNITRGSPHLGHGGARPRAPFTGVKPNIYAYKRTKCGRIDLIRAHLSRYRTHIQHTRAIEYSFLSAISHCPALLRRGTTISRTPLVAASDSHKRCSHTHVPRPASRPCRRPRATCAPATRVHEGGEISTNITRGSRHIATSETRRRTTRATIFGCPGRENTITRAPWLGVVRV